MNGLDVPDLVRRRALSHGSVGKQWLDDLSEIVAMVTTRWQLRLGSLFHSGTAGFVVETILQWGFIERVSTGLANLRGFGDDDDRAFLEVAARCRAT